MRTHYRTALRYYWAFVVLACGLWPVHTAAQRTDPLPSWNDGPAKQRILAFVRNATTKGSPDFVPETERIATFDNDGTLWVEKPFPVELYFALGRLRQLAAADPSLLSIQPYQAALANDPAYFHTTGAPAVLAVVMKAETEMSQDAFAERARAFLDTAHHPVTGLKFTSLVYQPMLEVLEYLRASGFTTWLCSGGTTDFMRAFAARTYGIPPSQVIGSDVSRDSRVVDGRRIIWRQPGSSPPNDRVLKPVNVDGRIGARPSFAAGNVMSGGDVAMLEYSRGRRGSSLQIVIHHDDSAREFAYDERDDETLKAAQQSGFIVVSMRKDWKTIFPAQP